MFVNCKLCNAQFSTRSKRDSYMIFEHISEVQVGELTVSRNSDGFPCPCCKKYFKTAKTLKEHLAKKQLKCVYIYDSMADVSPQTGSVEISYSLRMPDERDDWFTAATTTMNIGERETSTTMISISGNEDDETLATLSSATTTSIVPYISNKLTASIIPSSTPTSPSSSSPLSVPT